ncbi:TonB-dependent receptor domain-containing protein [Leptolyngbya sp. AN03gr2]|uniref:TonB-dependent receptor domain-containing protein n=1 Tax=unclassified Leptolyngbya TaxID=2650499 RepID=UPI003D318620
MKLQLLAIAGWSGVFAILVTPQLVKAGEIVHLKDFDRAASTLSEWRSAQTNFTQITDARLVSTEAGIEIVLETADGRILKPQIRESGRTSIAEIQNAVLSTGKPFQFDRPTAEIQLITVSQSGNTVIVQIVGQSIAPLTEVQESQSGLILSVTAEDEEEEVVVTATRTEEPLQNLPRSVTIIRREQIQQQTALGRDLNTILGKLVPGLGAPVEQVGNAGQTLRGRPPQVLIDGVPVTSNISNDGFNRDLRSIAPEAIERVEVVRGPSAVFGDGATGGVINIITRRPTGQQLTSQTEVGIEAAIGKLQGDSFGNFFSHAIQATQGKFDLSLLLSRRDNGIYYDAVGDRISSDNNSSNAETLQGFFKAGINFDSDQRLQLTANLTRDRYNYNIVADPDQEVFTPFRRKTRTIQIPNPSYIGVEDPQTLNRSFSLDYSHRNLLGSKLNTQLYYRYTKLNSGFFDDGVDSLLGLSSIEEIDDKLGARVQIDTPLSKQTSLLWGVDYSISHIERTLPIFDRTEFESSGNRTLRLIEQRTDVPRHRIENLGLFAQLQWELSPKWLASGGVRYERFNINVPDFVNPAGDLIGGGKQNPDDVVFNAGVVYRLNPQISLYGSFAQGFSIPAINRILSANATPGFRFDRDVELSQPQKVNNYEIGIRGNWRTVQASIAGFYSNSELGTALSAEEGGSAGFLKLIRQPQRNYGVEAAIDWQPTTKLQIGSSITWSEGEADQDQDGEFLALDSLTVNPLKLTAYIQHQTTPSWSNRLQAVYVGSRDRAFRSGTEPGAINSYIVLDYISSFRIGSGTLFIGVENLLNNQYFTTYSQALGNFIGDSFASAARGRTIRFGYRIDW